MPSASRANGVAATPKKWQFVNVNEPKRYQDKDITSMVRAHAMRNVRRKQRLELTAQHQKRLEVAKAPESRYADSSVVSELSVHGNPNSSSIGHETDTDWSMALREMLSKLEFINLAHLASSNQVEFEAERDEDAQRPDHLQSYGEDGTRAPKRFMLGTRRTGNPKSLLGDGVLDPFNALPIGGCANYNSHVLNHCKYLRRNTFLFGQFPIWSQNPCKPSLPGLLTIFIPSRFGHGSQLSTSRPG